jgi:hypothetical protein
MRSEVRQFAANAIEGASRAIAIAIEHGLRSPPADPAETNRQVTEFICIE